MSKPGVSSEEREDYCKNKENTNTNKRWDDNETLLLINLAISKKEKFTDKKRELYKDISQQMATKGASFTPLQCENKLKFLINKYKDVFDHNNKTGNFRKDWKYYQLMEEFMGDKDIIRPKAKCSSLKLLNAPPAPCQQEEVII